MEDLTKSLGWPQFGTYSKNAFQSLYSDKDFLDVTLIADDDKQFKAHKVILISSSSFFHRALTTNPHPHPLLFLKGVTSSSLSHILELLYIGQVVS